MPVRVLCISRKPDCKKRYVLLGFQSLDDLDVHEALVVQCCVLIVIRPLFFRTGIEEAAPLKTIDDPNGARVAIMLRHKNYTKKSKRNHACSLAVHDDQ